MNKYVVYFTIYGKKLKTTIYANNKKDAMDIIKEKIIFDNIVEVDSINNDMLNNLKNLFNI